MPSHIFYVLDLDARAIITQVASQSRAEKIAESYQRRHGRTTAVSRGVVWFQWDE